MTYIIYIKIFCIIHHNGYFTQYYRISTACLVSQLNLKSKDIGDLNKMKVILFVYIFLNNYKLVFGYMLVYMHS